MLLKPDQLSDLGILINDRQRRRLEAIGEFPRRVQLTARTCGYVKAEIEAYLEKKIAQRDSSAA
jgi:predicted DNA-binding transcriptional regulator AlpA